MFAIEKPVKTLGGFPSIVSENPQHTGYKAAIALN
jgi:hypothetical protein